MMTQEEAIKALRLERGIEINGNAVRVAEFLQGLDVAISALRPVSREKVEKVWRGEWIKLSAYRGMEQYKCSKCGQEIYVPEFMGEPIYSFCPMCSSAMMDSSVDLMIDKLGGMKFE